MIHDLDYLEKLDFLESVSSSQILGARGATVKGNVYADSGVGTANTYAAATGTKALTSTKTSVDTTMTIDYSRTTSTAKASAISVTYTEYSSAHYIGNADYLGFMGSSMTMTSTFECSTYMSS